MTTSAQLEAALQAAIFNDNTLKTTYSPRLIKHLTDDQSEAEIEAMSFGGKINYFSLLIERDVLQNGVNMRDYSFRIRIGYYVEKTDSNLEWAIARNGMEKATDLLITAYNTGLDVVDIIQFQTGVQISPAVRGGVTCWGAELPLTAVTGI